MARWQRSCSVLLALCTLLRTHARSGHKRLVCSFTELTRIHTRLQVELKNLNSFRAVQESVDFEIVRQAKCVFSGCQQGLPDCEQEWTPAFPILDFAFVRTA